MIFSQNFVSKKNMPYVTPNMVLYELLFLAIDFSPESDICAHM